MPFPARFVAKYTVDENNCWLWTAYRSPDGYGRFGVGKHSRMAHRFAYEQAIGPIPEGLQIDHLCRVRRCVNPAHLRLLTWRENIALRDTSRIGIRNREKTHCPKGHAYSSDNTAITIKIDGVRRGCRTCHRERERVRAQQRRKAHRLSQA